MSLTSRTSHYWASLFFGIFILSSAVTGLLWAYAPYLYWADGYKARKRAMEVRPLDDARLGVREALGALPNSSEVTSVTLTSDAGRVFYILTHRSGERSLIDAVSGERWSPLPRELAETIASSYAPPNSAVRETRLIAPWSDRKKKVYAEVWQVDFDDKNRTQIVIDARTAEIAEDSDRIRRFHFWIMDLHQFNFFGTHKVLSAISGVPLLFLIVTGSILSVRRLRATLGKRR